MQQKPNNIQKQKNHFPIGIRVLCIVKLHHTFFEFKQNLFEKLEFRLSNLKNSRQSIVVYSDSIVYGLTLRLLH